MATKVGILHPGKMGVAVAATVAASGCEVYWISEGRSEATRKRAEQAGLLDAGTLARLCEECSIVISVCPPEFAEQVATEVSGQGFAGMFVDANAISPLRSRAMAVRMESAGIRYVDGGIVGRPPREKGKTWLYLSGPRAGDAVACFAAGPMEVEVLGEDPGQASALKMCFAGWTKCTRALSVAILAAANEMGVLEQLKRQWSRSGPDFDIIEREIRIATPKAWRFGAEMREIAATLEAAGLPGEFHHGAEELFDRLASFKNDDEVQLADVLTAAVRSPTREK